MPGVADCSLSGAKGIIGHTETSKPTWYSPGVDALPTEHLDLHLIRFVVEHGLEDKAPHAWLGCFVRAEHRIALRMKQGESWGPWRVAAVDVPNICAVAVPATMHDLPGYPGMFFLQLERATSIDDFLFPLVDLDSVEACTLQWRSPLSVAQEFPMATSMLPRPSAGILPLVVGSPEPLLKVAARQAFWEMPQLSLSMIARHVGIELPRQPGLLPALLAMVQATLGIDEAAALEVCSKRLGAYTPSCYNELLEVEEAWEVMDQNERSECQQQQSAAKSSVAQQKEYKEQWKARRALVVAAAAPKAKGRGRGKGRGKGAALALPPGALTHQQLRPLVPPGGHLWRSNATNGWEAHVPNYRRVAYSGNAWGPRSAAVYCLRYLWEAYLTAQGMPKEQCPVAGLWSDDAVDTVLPQ